MIRETMATNVRQNLSELLNEMQYRKGRFVITKAGKPVGALVDIDLFERIRRLDDEFETLTREIVDAFSGIEPVKGMKLVGEAVAAARQKKRAPLKRGASPLSARRRRGRSSRRR